MGKQCELQILKKVTIVICYLSKRNYMNQKSDKLHNQFEDSREEATEVSQLFKGISIHVNGLTGTK